MNYYERYCGDYAKKTARLSLMEHGAYTLLLDEYYSNEAPLPADFDELFRICRAMKKAEQDAVKSVAEKFFPIFEDGMRHNARADEMIARARPKMEAARANGAKGGRPRKNPMGYENKNPEKTQQEPNGKPNGFSYKNPEETQGETIRARSPAPAPTPLGTNNLTDNTTGIGTDARMTPSQVSAALIGWERERGKAARGISASQPQVIELSEGGVDQAELRAAYDDAVADRSAVGDPNPINAGFVKTFVEKRRRPAPKRDSKVPLTAMTDAQRDEIARKLGIGTCRAGESRDAFIARIRAKQAETEARAA